MSEKGSYHHPQRAVMGHVDLPPTAFASLSVKPPHQQETDEQPQPPTTASHHPVSTVPPPPRSQKSQPPSSSLPPPPRQHSRSSHPVQSSPLPPNVPTPSTVTPSPSTVSPATVPSTTPPSFTPTSATLPVPPAPPSFIRHAVSCLPSSPSIASKWTFPCGFVVSPFPDLKDPSISVERVNLGEAGPLRCSYCRTYVNPYFEFHDGGRRFVCNICKKSCETDESFIYRLSSNNSLQELTNSVVDFSAPSEYTMRPPQAPCYYFLIDVSTNAHQSGFVKAVCDTIRSSLQCISGDERTLVGFLVFDTKLRFFKFFNDKAQEFVVPDVEDMFIPSAEGLVVNLRANYGAIEGLLDYIPSLSEELHNKNNIKSNCLGSAVVAGASIIGFNGGRILLFAAQRPDLGSFSLEHRERKYENVHSVAPSHIHELLKVGSPVIKDVAVQCCRRQITIDSFIDCSEYIDVASIGSLSKITGGSVVGVRPMVGGPSAFELLSRGVKDSLCKINAWESVLRVRIGQNVDYTILGHLFQGQKQLVSIPVISVSNNFGVLIPMNYSTELNGPYFYSQVAVLFTSSRGERIIRVINSAIPIKNNLAEMFKEVDIECIMSLLVKSVANSISTDGAKIPDLREDIIKRVVSLLATYRSSVRQSQGPTHDTQLVLPEKFRLLPVLVLSLLKSPLLRLEPCHSDRRACLMFSSLVSSVSDCLKLIHPQMVCISDYLEKEEVQRLVSIYSYNVDEFISTPLELPPSYLRLSSEFVKTTGVYVVLSEEPIIFVGKDVDLQMFNSLFEIENNSTQLKNDSFEALVVKKLVTSELGLESLINSIRVVRHESVEQRDFYEYLVETKLSSSSISYLDFLTLLHKSIKQRLSG
ncbi:hypothetical protein P9112_004302 [Eukaryota sp. TZLM1-RC]